jgi:hypothetical protein
MGMDMMVLTDWKFAQAANCLPRQAPDSLLSPSDIGVVPLMCPQKPATPAHTLPDEKILNLPNQPAEVMHVVRICARPED